MDLLIVLFALAGLGCFFAALIAPFKPLWLSKKTPPSRKSLFFGYFVMFLALFSIAIMLVGVDTGKDSTVTQWVVSSVLLLVGFVVVAHGYDTEAQPVKNATATLEKEPKKVNIQPSLVVENTKETDNLKQQVESLTRRIEQVGSHNTQLKEANASLLQQLTQSQETERLHLDDILHVIIADGVVSIDEVRYLASWLKDKKDHDSVTLLFVLESYLSDGELSEDEEANLLRRFRLMLGIAPSKPFMLKPDEVPHLNRPVATWVGLTVKFDYVDATKTQSRRHATIKKIVGDKVYTWDFDRNAVRTFIAYRMSNVVDVATGECLSD